MPTYEFQNIQTGEVIEKILTISGREVFLNENPDYKQVHLSAPKLVSGVSVKNKVDGGFTEVMEKIARAHPTSTLAERVGGRKVKQVNSDKVAKKHGFGKTGKYKMEELEHGK